MKTEKTEVTVNPVVEKAIVRTNKFATKIEVARNALFDVVRKAINDIGESKDDLAAYRSGIEKTHRSTVYVMITAASNSLLSQFKSELPNSYQTLYELHKLNKAIGDDRFVELIEAEEIHSEMSKANVTSLRKKESVKTTDFSEENAATTGLGNEDNVVSADFERIEPVKISTLDEIKSAFDALDENVKKEFAAYVASLTSQQKEAA
jgi:hypothetical protein